MKRKIYGAELRQSALGALARGESRGSVSAVYGIPLPTLDRWRRQEKQGQIAPRPRGHKRCAFEGADLEQLSRQLHDTPDATLEQHLKQWQETTGRRASRSSLHRAIVRLKWSYKKRV